MTRSGLTRVEVGPWPIRRYVDQPGDEPNGTVLSFAALDANATALTSGLPCEFVVEAEYRDAAGSPRLLEYAMNPAFMRAVGYVPDDELSEAAKALRSRRGDSVRSSDRRPWWTRQT